MKFLNKAQRIALYLFFFSINFEMWDPFNTNDIFSIAKLTAILYFITIAPHIFQYIRTDSLKAILYPAWIFFGFLTFMSMINSNELFSGFFYSSIFLNIILFWFLINHERIDYLIIEKGMFCFALGSILMVGLFFAGIGIEYLGNRLSMFGDNQNALGVKVAISSIILIVSVVQNRLNIGWYRYLLLLMLPFMLIFIRETGSRVAVIAFILAFFSGTILYKTKTHIVKVGILIGSTLALVLFVIILMQSDTLAERFVSTATTGEIGSRDKIWKTIIPIISENPIVGIGKTGYDLQSTINIGKAFSPHNVILEVLCYTGIIGLFLYLTFLYQVFKRGFLAYYKNGWLLPLLLIIPMLGLILSGQILTSKTGWTIFAYIVSSSAVAIKSLRNQKENLFINENSLRN